LDETKNTDLREHILVS